MKNNDGDGRMTDQQAQPDMALPDIALPDMALPNVLSDVALDDVALCDRSNWGRIEVRGGDRLRFLHNQSTNAFNGLQPGQGCDTVFITSTARTIDLVTAYILEDAVLLLTSPGHSQSLIQWMDRFIFFADKVELKDVSETTSTFSIWGAGCDSLVRQLGAESVIGQPYGSHQLVRFKGHSVRVAVGSGLATPGYTLIGSFTDQSSAEQPSAEQPSLWEGLVAAGARAITAADWERLRIEQGRPSPGLELTDEVNPLEAGLWHTISLSKGCYIGQETIARLHTYRGVKQQLWGIRLATPVAPDSVVTVGEDKVGKVTSCTATEQGFVGLAYIRTKAAQPPAAGLTVQVAGQTGDLVALPFVSHEYP